MPIGDWQKDSSGPVCAFFCFFTLLNSACSVSGPLVGTTAFDRKGANTYRLLALAIAASTALAATIAVAAPECVRCTVVAVSGDTLTVRTALGQNVPVMLPDKTRYLKVAPSSLDHVDPGARRYLDQTE